MIKAKLHKKGLEERDAFNFFQAGGEGKDKDVVTLQDFHMAMDQVRVLVMGFLELFLVSSVVFCVSSDLFGLVRCFLRLRLSLWMSRILFNLSSQGRKGQGRGYVARIQMKA